MAGFVFFFNRGDPQCVLLKWGGNSPYLAVSTRGGSEVARRRGRCSEPVVGGIGFMEKAQAGGRFGAGKTFVATVGLSRGPVEFNLREGLGSDAGM